MGDDKPICPVKMTFEELIELKMQQTAADEVVSTSNSPGVQSRKHFLKKGEGMTRWCGKNNSPESEQPSTPQGNKAIRRKILSVSKGSASGKLSIAPRVPSHVVSPRSPRQSQTVKGMKPTTPVFKRGKQSPVPPIARSLQSDFSSRSSTFSRNASPGSFIPTLAQANVQAEPKPIDVTLCSEMEFEQMEEFIGDHPNDVSLCSQASVVRKFMTRPSIGLKPTNLEKQLATENEPKEVDTSTTPTKSCPSVVSQDFQDDEAWVPDPNLKLDFTKPPSNIVDKKVQQTSSECLKKSPVKEASSIQKPEKIIAAKEQPSSADGPNSSESLQPLNDVLRTKILQLDVEIDKFRTENRRLEERKSQFEKVQSDFISEKRKFDSHMENEAAKFEQFKRQELSKIKRERTALDQLRTQVHTLASEKNSVELTQLRERLRKFEQDASEKEDRILKELNRTKEHVKRLQSENEELKQSIEMLERLRIDRNVTQKAKTESSSNSPRMASVLQSLRKPLPLKNDARQNCIAEPKTALTKNSNISSSNEKQQPQQHQVQTVGNVTNSSDKEDERDICQESQEPSLEKQPAEIEQEDKKDEEDSSAVKKLIESMEPAHASILQKWLSDLGFTLLENDSNCVATLEKEFPDGKIEVTRSDGSRRIMFSNGTIKITGQTGTPVFIRFFNKDMKKVTEDGITFYYYADTETVQTTHPDGSEIMEFPNGQVEKKFPNGMQDVIFPDGTVKQTYPDGMEVCTFVDGCVVTTSSDGERVIEFPNGQKEIHTAEYKSRVYPSGIVRIVFKSGLCETRYPNGEVRHKYIRETATKDPESAADQAPSSTVTSSQEAPA